MMNVNTGVNAPTINTNNKNESAKLQILEANSKEVKMNFTEKISKEEASEIRAQITENAKAIMFNSTSVQTGISSSNYDFATLKNNFDSFLDDVGYTGKPIAQLSQSEAAELVSEDGVFGITQTSERIADFVISGAGNNEDLLRAGRAGMIQGFKEAEALWGGELPEISQKTMQAAIEKVDKVMQDFGFSLVDTKA